MIVIAVLVMTVFHPGWCFPQISKFVRKESMASSEIQIEAGVRSDEEKLASRS